MSEEAVLQSAIERAERHGTQAQLANALDKLSAFHHRLGNYDAAAAAYRRAAAIWRPILGPEHPVLGTLFVNLVDVLLALGRHDEVGPILRQAVDIIEGDPEHDDPNAIAILDRGLRTLRAAGLTPELEALTPRVARIAARVSVSVRA